MPAVSSVKVSLPCFEVGRALYIGCYGNSLLLKVAISEVAKQSKLPIQILVVLVVHLSDDWKGCNLEISVVPIHGIKHIYRSSLLCPILIVTTCKSYHLLILAIEPSVYPLRN
jgi:hypothetical protein